MPSVLIADDEPNIRRMVGALLRAEGYEVREAPDGRGALEGWEATPHQRLERLCKDQQVRTGILVTDGELRRDQSCRERLIDDHA